MTGAPIPKGADAVIPVEHTKVLPDGRIRLEADVTPGQNICRRGEDVGRGERVLSAGAVIGGPEVAACASIGAVRVPVIRRPLVSVLPTGSEIVEADRDTAEEKIRNSNGPMLLALLEAAGVRTRYLGIGADDREVLQKKVTEGLQGDVLLISGGVSMGDYDMVPEILKKCGARTLFHRVRVKPGKPLLFARTDSCFVFGIPGNPVSNFTTFHLFVNPALRKMGGYGDQGDVEVSARLTRDVVRRGDRTLILPSLVRLNRHERTVTPLELNGSADIIGCAGCNGLLRVDEERIHAGTEVPVTLIGV
jgi:molybdopterin molybdotransferase